MKKYRITGIIAGAALCAALAGCGQSSAPAAEDKQEASAEEPAAVETQADASASETEDKSSYDPASFKTDDVYPAPEQAAGVDITGCDTFTQIVDKLEDGRGYANVKIGDEDVLLVASGTYEWEPGLIFNYDLNGDTLECSSGGSYPGCIHMKFTEEGYEVISNEIVADGGDFTESAKKIFADNYDAFMKDGEDEKLREELRVQIVANYVAANNLSITAIKDYGWDPVPLPEENIDSFYSILD